MALLQKSSWMGLTNQRASLRRIGDKLGILELSDWYSISRQQFVKNGGSSLYKHYPSLREALQRLYPEHPWDPLKFVSSVNDRMPQGHWQNRANVIKALHAAEQRLNIEKPEDWYSVQLTDLREVGFPAKTTKQQLLQLLAQEYPDFKWEATNLLRGRYAQQKRLENAVASLFPGQILKTNVRKEVGLINPETGDYLELDIYLPALNLAFEYQDIHHYTTVGHVYQPLEEYKKRDEVKRQLVQHKGIDLLIVPCWWDGKEESLVDPIKKLRPDLLKHLDGRATESFPEDMPPNFLEKHTTERIEDIGQPVTACFMTKMDIDPRNWWMFEKYDGVRAFWNPLRKAFYSRFGKTLPLPQQIVDAMPSNTFLDGELWFGRDNFQESMKIAQRMSPEEIDWTKFRYMVFDMPAHKGTYEERYRALEEVLGQSDARGFIELASKEVCRDVLHLEQFFQDVIDEGGEGIILRNPTTPYEEGRSKGFLKHKKFRDAEAKVVACKGMNQWECELPNGVKFVAVPGTSEFVKRWDPKVGDIVSFKHHGFLLGSKKPKLPTLYRVRTDRTWQDVVEGWKEQKPTARARPLVKRKARETRPKGFWRNWKNVRSFFVALAKERGFDPLDVNAWHELSNSEIGARSGAGSMLRYYENYHQALMDAFPELQFNFQDTPSFELYSDPKVCRQLFDDVAKQRGRDPLDPETWYSIGASSLVKIIPHGRVVRKFNGGMRNAIRRAYPELRFDKWPQESSSVAFWTDPKTLKEFFKEFAKEQNFDPSDAKGWRECNLVNALKMKGGDQIQELNGGLKRALKRAFPDLALKL